MKEGEEEVEIKVTVGVKQGDNLPSILFIILIQAVSTTLDKKWNFATTDYSRHTLQKDGGVKYNPSLRKKVSTVSQSTGFSFWKSYYVDDTAYLRY